ncbi:MFS transporter [Candidatus Heimdallarchaeota archaeon]|nr:MAG: MFS transporter [Candidatus Heimdallarchaeota archaeon]
MATEVSTKKSFTHYLFFWGGQQFSLLGSNIVQFVLVIWIVNVTRSELMVSVASLVAFGPMVLLGPIAGVFVDRWNRKLIIGITDTLQALVTVGMLFYVRIIRPETHQTIPALVFVIIACRGILQAFHGPTVTAIIPTMVPQKHLSRMNSVNFLTNSIVLMIGPALAATLLLFIPDYLLMLIDVVTWAIAITPLIFVKIPSLKDIKLKMNNISEEPVSEESEKSSFIKEFVTGLKFVKGTKGLLAFILMATFLNFLLSPAGTLLSPYILLDNNRSFLFSGLPGLLTMTSNIDSLAKGIFLNEMQGMLALVSALINAGVFVSSLFLIFFKGFKKKIITWVMIFVYIEMLGYALLGLSPFRWFWMMGLGMFMLGMMMPLINVTMITILQITTPLEMQGRVMSVVMTLASAITPIGIILSGVFAELITTKLLMISTMGMSIVMATLFWVFSDLKHAADKVEQDDVAQELTSKLAENLSENQDLSER